MSIRRRHIKRSSPIRYSTVCVPVFKPAVGLGKVHANMALHDGAGEFKSVGTELTSTTKISPGCGLVFTATAIDASHSVGIQIAGYDQFGDEVAEDITTLANGALTQYSLKAYSRLNSVKVRYVETNSADNDEVVKVGYDATTSIRLGIPAKLNATSEFLGAVCVGHTSHADQQPAGVNLTTANIDITNHSFTLGTGTDYSTAGIATGDGDIIVLCILNPTSSAL